MYLLIWFLAAEFIWKLKLKQLSTASPGSNARPRQNLSVHLPAARQLLSRCQKVFFKEELGEGRDGARNSTYGTRPATQTPILHPQNSGQQTEVDACQPHSDRLQHTVLCQYFLLCHYESGHPGFQTHLSSSFVPSVKLLGGSHLWSPPQHQKIQAKLISVTFYIQGTLSFMLKPSEILLLQLGNFK